MVPDLPEAVHERILALCEKGDVFAAAEDWQKARQTYREAQALLSSPSCQSEAAVWILGALADVEFLSREYEEALVSATSAIAAGGLGNPFLHLRAGQAALELSRMDLAADELCRAYMGGGVEVFDGEDEKYLRYLQGRIRPPASGEW